MAELVTMPKLGFDMAEGTLVRWVKAEGDSVEKGEVIAEIETDKATVEVESNYQGVMFRHLVDEDIALPVNAPIAVIAEDGEEPSEDDINAMVAEAGGEQNKKEVEKEEKEKKAEKKEKKAEVKTQAEQEDEVGLHLPAESGLLP
jgi:pyruvate dehydrogenase E2 component (dihydrolipoamide acetyltransferase)